jgi:hypothetical protein
LYHLNLILLCFLITILSVCGGNGNENAQHIDMQTVQYEVSSYSPVPLFITYSDENGKILTISSIYVNEKTWTYTFSAKSGTYLYLSAELLGGRNDIFYTSIHIDYLLE